ncbi:MAG TPA: CPBP family glutamic-type intramembrane protease [Terriglobales bacterium]|nr:CPBP family glutamic-type intramembrane protease [Terriglobales bacterium]
MQIEPPLEPAVTEPAIPVNPGAENPPWSGLDLLLIGLVLVVSLLFFSSLLFGVVLHTSRSSSPGISPAELSKNPGPLVIVPSMTLAYLVMLAAMFVLVKRHHRRPFWQAVAWRWPGDWWLGYVVGGGLLAVGLGLLSRLLPIPKSLPMDRFFQDRQGAYLMMIFGVAVAPFAEEMLFRGFLYPVLDRWLQTLWMNPRQIRRGCVWLLIMAAWGFIEHRLPLAESVLLAVFVLLATAAMFVARSRKAGGQARLVLFPGAALVAWGLASRSLGHQGFESATITLVVLAALLGLIAMAPPVGVSVAGRWGRLLAVLITSGGFALVHSEQLGQAWGPLLVLFVVGLVLTLTRVVTRSVTPGLLVHVGYNLTLFTLLYLGTDHFRHLERMTQ